MIFNGEQPIANFPLPMYIESGYPAGYPTRTVVLSVSKKPERDVCCKRDINQSGFEAGELVTRRMIKDGYLELANHLVLRGFASDFNEEAIQLVRDFACTSQIKYFEAEALAPDGSYHRISNFATFIDVLKDSKCVETVRVLMNIGDFDVRHQRNFKIFWDVLTTILQMKKIKDIRFELRPYCADYSDLDLLNNYPNVSLEHVKSISICVWYPCFCRWFKYGESNETNMKDFAENFRGQFAFDFLNRNYSLSFHERAV